jgi:Transglutaminase-like superfamily
MPSSPRWAPTVCSNPENPRWTAPMSLVERAWRRAAKVGRLPARQKLALGRVLTALAIVEVGLRFVAADRLAARIGVPLRLSKDDAAPPALSDRPFGNRAAEMRMLRRVLPHWRFHWATPCLREALVSGILLRHRGPNLRLGVARRDGEVVAHAWVEVSGHSLGADSGFTTLGHHIERIG